jgi:rhodanese-related sulfurtransferase
VQFFIDNWPLILVAFTSGAFLVWPAVSRTAGAGSVGPTQAVQLMNRERAVVIDVSEPADFAKGHINGARNVPFGNLGSSKDLPSNKALPLILVCPSGARANRAVGTLRKLGYEKAVALAGGTAAWKEANLPVEAS